MGKKAKPKRNAPNRRQEGHDGRSLRKAEQYHQSKNKKETDETTDSKDAKAVNSKTDSSGNQSSRSNVKSCNSNSTIAPQGNHSDFKNGQNNAHNAEITAGNFRSVCVSENMEKLNKTPSKDTSQCDLNVSADSNAKTKNVPRPPRIDPQRMQRLFEMHKQETLQRMCNVNKQKPEENVENVDKSIIADIAIPSLSSNPTDVEAAIELLKKRNTEIQEKITSMRQNLEAGLECVINDEYVCNKELMMMKIAHVELTDNADPVSAMQAIPMPKQNDNDLPIPTKDAFLESRKILKRFIEIRNKRLLSCVSIEIRLNTIGDNYTNMLSGHRENTALTNCIVNKIQDKKTIGSQILIKSTKLLEKMQHQLRQHDSACFSKHHNSSSKSWGKKIRNYENTLLNLQQTRSNIKNCIWEKEKKFTVIEGEIEELDVEKNNVLKEKEKFEKSIELSILNSKCYLDLIKIRKNIRTTISNVKEKNDKMTEQVNSIRCRMKLIADEANKNEEVRNDVNLFNVFIVTMITSWEKKRKVHVAARKILHSLRQKVLREEEYQSDLKNKIDRNRNMYITRKSELEENLCKHKSFSRKLRLFSQQMGNFKYKNCRVAILKYAGNTNIGVAC